MSKGFWNQPYTYEYDGLVVKANPDWYEGGNVVFYLPFFVVVPHNNKKVEIWVGEKVIT